jgi:hypothetical protein
MSGTCDCGRTLRGNRQQCRLCSIAEDAVPVEERQEKVLRHAFAPECADCGEATHVGEWLLEDGTRAPNGRSDDGARYFCPECQPDEIDESGETSTLPAMFERASELRTDGGVDCDLIDVSTHARGRWVSRSDCQRVDPRIAWDEAESFELHNLTGDEGRWHEEGGVILIRKNCTIVTVLDEQISEVADRAELLELGADVAPVPSHVHPHESAAAYGGEQR